VLTKLTVRNLKQFDVAEIELAERVVFVGPNDAGKTTALQALALWETGLRRWNEKRKGKPSPEKRPGVTINRRDLISLPVPEARLLWRNLEVRSVRRVDGKQVTTGILIEVVVEGVTDGTPWVCGFELDYANPESFYCRLAKTGVSADGEPARIPVPSQAEDVRVAFLPPMSGLAAEEDLLNLGSINVRLGEGRTAEVLRNLCYQLVVDADDRSRWDRLCRRMERLFGVSLDEPVFIPERGQITMSYRNRSGTSLDLSASGRGMQQTLLLLAYLAARPGSVLLLDEPDAHLEVLRQREIYNVLSEAAREERSQIVAASHSEVILEEAADRDVVVAFVGRPHRIDDRGSQVLKSLRAIGFEHYYLAEIAGWVLYLEGSTDLAILASLAKRLDHPAAAVLRKPFVQYVGDRPPKAYEHFYGLSEAKDDLVGFALFDRRDDPLEARPRLVQVQWRRREIENYIAVPEALVEWAAAESGRGTLFEEAWRDAMRESVNRLTEAQRAIHGESWLNDVKASEEFLDPLFRDFFTRVGAPGLLRKTDYHTIADHMPTDLIHPEVTEVLDAIAETAGKAKPRGRAE